MNISLRQLRYFVAVAECGQITLAAAELGISQPSITEAVQALESEVGVKLLRRHGKGMILTNEGAQFLLQAKRILADVVDAVQGLRSLGATLEGSIRVGVTYTLSGLYSRGVLARFRRAFPGIEVRLEEVEQPQLERQLLEENLDLGLLIVSNLHNRRKLASEILFRSRRRLWIAPNHPLTRTKRVTLEDVAKEPFISMRCDEAERMTLIYWKKAGLTPNIVFSTSSMDAVRGLVANGVGVTILSDLAFKPWSAEGDRLEAIPLSDPVPEMIGGLVWKRDHWFTDAEEAFVQFLRNALPRGNGRSPRSKSQPLREATKSAPH